MLQFRKKILIGFIIILSMPLFGEIDTELSDLFNNAVNAWINAEITDDRAVFEMNQLDYKLNQLRNNRDKAYWKAKTALLRGQIFFLSENVEQSIIELEKSQSYALEALEFGDFGDGWRIMSDAGSYIMLQKGVGYIIANSAKVQEQAERALELEPDNARAGLIFAQGKMNAPALFGGNKKMGLEILQTLSKRTDLSVEDRYFIMMALSDAYIIMKKNDDAIRNYRMILAFYPNNKLAQNKFNEIK